MHHQVEPPTGVTVKLDVVVAAAQCAYAFVEPLAVPQLAVATQLHDKLLGLGVTFHILLRQDDIHPLAHVAPRRDVGGDVGVQGVEIDVARAIQRLHHYAAADVHPDDVGDHPLPQVAGEAYHTACPGVHVGHYPDLAAAEYVDGHQLPYLQHRSALYVVGENLDVVTLDGSHILVLL